MSFKSIVIFSKPKQLEVARVAAELKDWFERQDLHVQLNPQAAIAPETDLAVVIGGDGTLLAAARTLATGQIPTGCCSQGVAIRSIRRGCSSPR